MVITSIFCVSMFVLLFAFALIVIVFFITTLGQREWLLSFVFGAAAWLLIMIVVRMATIILALWGLT